MTDEFELEEIRTKAKYFDRIYNHWKEHCNLDKCGGMDSVFEFLDDEKKILEEWMETAVRINNDKNDYNTYLQLKKRFEKKECGNDCI